VKFSHESIDKNLLYQNLLLPSETGAQLGKIFLQSLIFCRFEIFEPPLFWYQIRMRMSAELALRTRRKEKWVFRDFPRIKQQNKITE
jgi:hypothetical protein